MVWVLVSFSVIFIFEFARLKFVLFYALSFFVTVLVF